MHAPYLSPCEHQCCLFNCMFFCEYPALSVFIVFMWEPCPLSVHFSSLRAQRCQCPLFFLTLPCRSSVYCFSVRAPLYQCSLFLCECPAMSVCSVHCFSVNALLCQWTVVIVFLWVPHPVSVQSTMFIVFVWEPCRAKIPYTVFGFIVYCSKFFYQCSANISVH